MSALREYVIHVSATALLCAMLLRLANGSGAIKMIIRLLCSIVLVYSIIYPLRQFDLPELEDFIAEHREEADRAVQWGENNATKAWCERISSGMEAYILEKSKELNLDLIVEVELSDDEIPVPAAVSLTGNAAPYAKSVLSKMISDDLNIPKEKQKWISQ